MIAAIYARKSTDQNLPDGGQEGNTMTIIFRDDSTLGRPSFTQVLRSGLRFGVIFHTAGVYRFYVGDDEKLGGPDLQDQDLDRLKTAIQSRYGGA